MRIRTSDRPRRSRRRLRSADAPRRARAAALAAAAVAVPSLALSTVGLAQTWTATVSGSWSTASNWTSLPFAGPSTTLNFGASGATTYDALDDFPGAFELQQVNFNGTSSGPLSVSTGSLSALRFTQFFSAINNNTLSDVSVNGRVKLTNGVNINPGVVGTNTTINATMSGPIGPTIFAGAGGAVTLAGQNTFTGLVTLVGRADVGAQTSLGTGTLYASGGTLGSTLFVSQSGNPPFLPVIANTIDDSSGSGMTLGGLFGYTLGGNITGGGTISLRPSNLFNQTWTLSGNNAGFTGVVNVQGSSSSSVTDTLVFNGAGALGGTGAVTMNGANGRVAFVGGASTITVNAPLIVGSLGGQLGALNVTNLTNVNYAGNITGGGTLTRFGPGYVTLTGANTQFTGTLNLAGGFTAANNEDNLGNHFVGAPISPITFNTGDLVLNPGFGPLSRPIIVQSTGTTAANPSVIYTADDVVYTGVMSSAGNQGYAKAGGGRLVLNNANTFTGSININGGTLVASGGSGAFVGPASTGSINVNQGAAIVFDSTVAHKPNRVTSGTPINLNGGRLELLGNANLNTGLNGGTSSIGVLTLGTASESGQGLNVISVTPGATANGIVRFSSLSRTANNGAQMLFTGLNLGANSFASLTPGASNIVFTTAPALVNGIFPYAIMDTTGGIGTDLATYDNTNGVRPVATYAADLNGGATSNASVGTAAPAGASATINALRMTGGTVSSTSGITVASGAVLVTGPSTVTGPLTVGTNGALTGNFFINADTTIAGTLNNATNTVLASGIAKSGPGMLTLSGTNTYSGPTRVLSGTLRLGSARAIPVIGNPAQYSEIDINPGATLDFNNFAQSVGSIQQMGFIDTVGNGPVPTINIGAGSIATGSDGFSASYAGDITGTGNIVKFGIGTWTVIGSQAFTGTLTVTNGTIAIGAHLTKGAAFTNAQRINIGTSGLAGDAALVFNFGVNSFATPILANTRAGSFATIKFAGAVGSFGGSGDPGMTLASPITINNNLTIDADGGQTISGVISGAGSLGLTTTTASAQLQNGPASFALNITGTNIYTGPTSLTAISTLWGNSAAFGNAATDIALGSTGGLDTPEMSSSVGGLTLTRNITLSDSTNVVPTFGIIGSRALANGGTTTYSGRITIAGQRNQLILYSQNPGAPVTFTGSIQGTQPTANVQVGYSLGTGLEFVNSNVTLSGSSTYAGGTRLYTGTLNLGRDTTVNSVGVVTAGPVGTGTLWVGTSGIPGATAPTITTANGFRTLANPVVLNNDVTFAGTSSLTFTGPFDLGGAARVVTVAIPNNGPQVTLAGPVTGAAGSALIIDGGGKVTMSGSASYAGPTAVWSGTLVMPVSQTLGGALYVTGSSRAVVSPNGSRVLTLPDVRVDTAGGAQLELNDNEMIVDYTGASPLASVTAQLASGFNGGAWTGPGIVSAFAASAAATSATPRTALGIIEASDTGSTSFAGRTVDNTSLLVRYTAAGDANLDGTVDLTDFTFLAANFNGTGKRWFSGDFNYDGNVDLTDFTFLASNFNQTVPGAAIGSSSLGTTVPEPTAIGLLTTMMSTTIARRRRHDRRA